MIKSCSNLIKIINKLFNDRNVELQKMAIWSEKNNISLNLTKTIHFFTRKRKKCHIKIDLPILYINNFEIVRESRTKFLGIYMDKNLTLKYDIEHICNKFSKNVGIMCKSRNSLGKIIMGVNNTIFHCSSLRTKVWEIIRKLYFM